MEKEWIGEVLAQQLFDRTVRVAPDMDWAALRREAHAQTTEIHALSFAVQNGAPDDFVSAWRMTVKKLILHNTVVMREHASLTALLEKAGIACCTLKGIASASYYPDILSRSMGDVDMLVSRADFERAGALLKENGYRTVGSTAVKETNHHVAFERDGIDVELHFLPCVLPKNDKKPYAESFLKTVLEERVRYETEFGPVYIPSARHHGFIMLVHMYNHLLKSGVGVRHLCDWAMFAARTPDLQEVLEEPLKKTGLWHFARLVTQAAEYVGLPEQAWAAPREDETARLLYDELLNAGNFGHKDLRYRSSMRLLPEEGKEQTGAVRRAFAYACYAAKEIWPFFEKHPVFLPAGVLMYALRAPFRLLSRQARLGNLKEDMIEADRRAALFVKLDLWKDER